MPWNIDQRTRTQSVEGCQSDTNQYCRQHFLTNSNMQPGTMVTPCSRSQSMTMRCSNLVKFFMVLVTLAMLCSCVGATSDPSLRENFISKLRQLGILRLKDTLSELSLSCSYGDTLPHPLSRSKYFFCTKSDSYEVRKCESDGLFLVTTGQCTGQSNVDPSPVQNLRYAAIPHARMKRQAPNVEPESPDLENENTDLEAGNPDLDPSTGSPDPLPDSTNKTERSDSPVDDVPEPVGSDNSTNMAPDVPTSPRPTTQTSASTTKAPTTTQAVVVTTAANKSVPEVIVPIQTEDPPYVIITEATTQGDVTATEPKSSRRGAVIGILVALLVVVVLIIVIVILVKKKKINVHSAKLPVKRKKIVTRMENPQYGGGGPSHTYRFSRDTSLQVGPSSAMLTKFNNPNLAETPVPKVLQSDSPLSRRQNSLPKSIASRREKRKAPIPPNPFGEVDDDHGALFEKASQGSMELHTFAVKNENADNNDNETTYPLLKQTEKDNSSSLENGKVKGSDGKQEQQGTDKDDTEASKGLLSDSEKRGASNEQLSADYTLDEYDMTNNPFFAKT